MKTFEEIYNELQNNDNSELNSSWEEANKERKKSKKISLIICLIIDAFFLLFFLKSGMTLFALPLLMFALVSNFIICMVVTIFSSKNYNKYNIKYKNIVINKLMNNFYNNVEYFPTKVMPEYIYREVNYNEYYNRYMSEDYMEGYIKNKYSIQMAEIKTQKVERYRDSDGKTHTRTITKFYGLFAKILMEKPIKGQLEIMQNGKIWSKAKLEMDSSEFEKYFDVKASDKIVGMQILTADVMEELIAFLNNTNMRYDIYINNNELYIRFHCGEMFETGKLKDGPIDRETIKKYFYMLNFTYNLSNKLIDVINEVMI